MSSPITKKRFFALIIDIIFAGIIFIITLGISMVLIDDIYLIGNKFFINIFIAGSVGYAIYFCKDTINGQSVGKKIFRIQVVMENGIPAKTSILVLRNVIALFQPFDALYMINNQGRRYGDIVFRTKVIYNKRDTIKYRTNFLKVIFAFVITAISCFLFLICIYYAIQDFVLILNR